MFYEEAAQLVMGSDKSPKDYKHLIDLLSDNYDDECDDKSNTRKELDIKVNSNNITNWSFSDLLDEYNKPYKFPYENYEIAGDTAEIDRVINTCGFINIDVIDIESTLSKESVNYVTVGSAEGEGCIANALKDAIGELPIEIRNVSQLLFNIWMPKSMPTSMTEMRLIIDIINPLSSDIDICWGCAYDESLKGQQAKVTLIAASK